jgi:hypothetical protein
VRLRSRRVKSQRFISVRAESYLTHNPAFSTKSTHRKLRIAGVRHGRGMKFAIVVAAFLIGLVTGLATNPDPYGENWEKLQRRESLINSN